MKLDKDKIMVVLRMLDDDPPWPINHSTLVLGWCDKEHSGDCRKQPWTCIRCYYDELSKRADYFIQYYEELDDTSFPKNES